MLPSSIEGQMEQLQKAAAYKDEGNAHFKNGNLAQAMQYYHLGILHAKALEKNDYAKLGEQLGRSPVEAPPEVSDEARAIVISCYNNLAACQLREKRWEKVATYATHVLERDAKNAKALYRRAQANFELNDIRKAEQDVEAAHGLDPSDAMVVELRRKVHERLRFYEEKQKKEFAGMFDR